MTGLPTVLVELDDGTGTFPHDITAYVHMPTGWSVERGRPNEFDDVDPGQLRLRLDNVDGRFTLGAPTYPVYVDQRIRLTEILDGDVFHRHTGHVQDWPLEWASPTANVATVRISSIDRLSRLSRRKLRSLLESEIFLDDPLAYYTLAEPEGSASAGDTSGNGNPALTQAGTGSAVTFGTATGPDSDDLTAASFAGGKYLAANTAAAPSAGGMSVELFCAVPSGTGIGLVRFGDLSILIDGFGKASAIHFDPTTGGATPISGTTTITDGDTHHIAATWDGATLRVYVDGTDEGSIADASATGDTPGFWVGNARAAAFTLTGVAAHAAGYGTALSAARIAAHAGAGLTGLGDQPSDERIERLATYAGLTAGDLDLADAGVLEVPTQGTAGSSPLDAMRRVTTAEGGTLFIAGDGRLTMHNRTHRVHSATSTPALELASTDIEHDDLTISADKAYLQNTVTGSRSGGATQTVVNQASIDTHDEYPADLSDLLVSTDAEVLARISWQVNAYSEPRPRLSSVTIDLYTLPTATQKAVLGVELGDRVTVSGMPTQAPFSTADLIVEAIVEEQTQGSWRISFNTAPAELFHAWILGDPVHGVLGSTTRPHY